jgi:hypothetical protein
MTKLCVGWVEVRPVGWHATGFRGEPRSGTPTWGHFEAWRAIQFSTSLRSRRIACTQGCLMDSAFKAT